MPGFLLHVGAVAMCPHGGQMSIISSNTRVLVGGQPVATLADTYMIAGCAFTIPPPQPCVMVKWLSQATRVLVSGTPVILQNSVGLCQSAGQIPAGPPNVVMTQVRVKGE